MSVKERNMNKLLNGFNDGLHRSSGIGGKRPFNEEKQICSECNGEGILNVSDCCGASPLSNGDSDTSDIGICPECGDHCSYDVKCETCKGIGEI